MDKLQKILEWANKVPKPEPLPEDLTAYDLSGGNFDDAWSGGMEQGAAEEAYDIAQMLIKIIEAE